MQSSPLDQFRGERIVIVTIGLNCRLQARGFEAREDRGLGLEADDFVEGAEFILDLERVPDPGSEASVAVSCFERLARHVPGTQAIVYDTALRGVHHQKILAADQSW